VIYVGLDDTDMPDSPGTNKLARALAAHLADRYACTLIVRHQLLQDSRVPYTSQNSAASLLLTPQGDCTIESLASELRAFLRERFIEGSDPGICVTSSVPDAVVAHGKRCQQELTSQRDARRLARRHGIHLEGLGGTQDGVIGALAAVGLAAEGNDGRVVQIADWPDDLAGQQKVETLRPRGVEVRCIETGERVIDATVDVGKHLRPNYRKKKIVLFARRARNQPSTPALWQAIRLT
jgi:tRNA(Ile2) C34 agmatinyltransferase TiaS